jgi:hypothetical protein
MTEATPARRAIPVEMWNQMRQADRISSDEIASTVIHARARILAVGQNHGFTEDEMLESGLVGRPENPPFTYSPSTVQPYVHTLEALLKRNATDSDTLHGVLDNETVAAISQAATLLGKKCNE